MNIVLFHSGTSLPDHLDSCLRQFRLFNPDIKVHFLTDACFVNDNVFKEHTVDTYNKEDYHSIKVDRFETAFNYRHDSRMYQFWVITALRLIYIENFIREMKLINVCHFENDVLVYCNLKHYQNLFVKRYSSMAVTVGGPDKCMTGMMFIRSYKSLEQMTQFFIDKLEMNDKKRIMQMYHLDMINEMTLMRAYSKDYPDKLEFLPILPFGEYSKGIEDFDSIFDPASYGQYLGGNVQEKKSGLRPLDHYIGKIMHENADYKVIFKQNGHGRIPYFCYDGKEIRINNLHIHSKELFKYMS